MPFVVRCYSSLVVCRTLKIGTESVPEMLEQLSNSASYGAPVRLIAIFHRLSTLCNPACCLELMGNVVELELLPLLGK